MRFLFKLAWRDARASRGQLLLTALAIVAGVAALAATGSLGRSLRAAIDGQARALLGADLVVESRSAPDAESEAYLAKMGGEQAREIAFASMLAVPDPTGTGVRASRLVTVRATENAYPFYGEVVTEPAGARAELNDDRSVLVEESLLLQFSLAVGDTVRLGRKDYRVAGALRELPGESAAVALLSPRVVVSIAGLEGTGLLGPGALARWRTHFRYPEGEDVEALAALHRPSLRALRMNEDTVGERRREMGRALENVGGFLRLTGLVALLLGAIGVASALNALVRRKLPIVAVLRCLGAGAGLGLGVFMVQGLAVAVAGSVTGALLGAALQAALAGLVRDFLPLSTAGVGVHWGEIGFAAAVGVALGALCTLVPLLGVRRVAPLGVLRAVEPETGRRDPWRWAALIALIALVTALAAGLAGKREHGLGFVAGAAGAAALLALVARLVMVVMRRLLARPEARALPFTLRQGLASLHRPGNRTVRLLVALGLGAFLLLSLDFARGSLMGQLRVAGAKDRPNLLFFDVQDDQTGPLKTRLAELGVPAVAESPIITMRLARVKGRAVEELMRDRASSIPGWTLRREYRSSYRAQPAATESVVAGRWVERFEAAQTEDEIVPVSLEQGLAGDLKVSLGDEFEWDVQGVPIRSRVESLRQVEWQRMSPNFFVLFPPGVLEDAPKFHVLAARAEDAAVNARAQREIVAAFPNVSVLDLGLVIASLDTVFGRAETAVRFLAAFTLATGVIVLAGALAAGRDQRVREAVLLRTLGASSGQVRAALACELAALGLLAGGVGAVLALGGGAAASIYVFKTTPVLAAGPVLGTLCAVASLTVGVGLLTQRGIARRPPLETLRAEG